MTLQQVEDLREDGEALFELLDTLTDDQWALPTPFKSRTVNWVVRHLHDTANAWMRMAQCFAGEPQEPPAPGERAW